MRKRKSKHKEDESNNNMKDILHKCFILSEKPKKDGNYRIIEIRTLRYSKKKKNVINLISDSQDRFHIPGEKLTATHVLQHQIPTTDNRPINTRQYRFLQIYKEEVNRQVKELLGGHRKAFSVTV